jgi:hypothetical protein
VNDFFAHPTRHALCRRGGRGCCRRAWWRVVEGAPAERAARRWRGVLGPRASSGRTAVTSPVEPARQTGIAQLLGDVVRALRRGNADARQLLPAKRPTACKLSDWPSISRALCASSFSVRLSAIRLVWRACNGTDLIRALGNTAGGLPFTLALNADGWWQNVKWESSSRLTSTPGAATFFTVRIRRPQSALDAVRRSSLIFRRLNSNNRLSAGDGAPWICANSRH